MSVLTHEGFIVPYSLLKKRIGSEQINVLFKKLTIITPQKIGPPIVAKMYEPGKCDGKWFVRLPRTLMRDLLEKKILNSVKVDFAPPTRIGAEPEGTPIPLQTKLFDNQQLILEYLMSNVFTPERISGGTATGILNLRAGLGKTFVAAGVISRLRFRTLYIVPKRPLAAQAARDIAAALPQLSIANGLQGAEDADIVVLVINTALMQPSEFFRGFGLVILDEVHSYCSAQRRKILWSASTWAVLGMSATTEDRADGLDIIAHKELAFDGIIRAENIPGFAHDEVKFDCTAKVIKYYGPPEYTQNLTHESTGLVFTHYMHEQFLNDKFRLSLAVNELAKLYNDGHNIYVFAEEIELLRRAKEAFEQATGAAESEMFIGGLDDERLAAISDTARVLFSTYGYAGTGISIVRMSAILFLTPRKANMKQILARILRRGSDPAIPRVVVDIVDEKTALRHQFKERRAAYDQYGFKISTLKIWAPEQVTAAPEQATAAPEQ
jgi:DNA or RNA helicases of superfamily II